VDASVVQVVRWHGAGAMAGWRLSSVGATASVPHGRRWRRLRSAIVP